MASNERIAGNFSKGAAAYDELAACQRHAARKLANIIIARTQGMDSPRKVIELGCGTGFLTEKLFSTFTASEFTVTDISDAMLGRCRDKTSGLKVSKRHFIPCDFDRTIPEGGYDMIVSGMSFQWSSDLEKLASSLHSHLRPGGMLFLSMLIEPTFGSLKKTFKELEIRYPGPEFRTESQIRKIFSGFSRVNFIAETYSEKHRGTAGFLKHLNRIGAGNPGGERIPAGNLRKIISSHDGKHSFDGLVEAEYRILYGALQK